MKAKYRSEPYVGVSGVINPEQQQHLFDQANEDLKNAGRHLAIGVKATHKPQFDDIENKYGSQWYLVGDDISKALDPGIQTFNVLQTYLEHDLVEDDADYPQRFFNKVSGRSRHYLDAVQIDLLRYERDPERYRPVIKAMASMGIRKIVQCHGYAMEAGPQKAIESIKKLMGNYVVDYVLFDASHGRGEAMNPAALLPFLEAAYADGDLEQLGTNFGVAGGLNGDNLDQLLGKILPYFPTVSWDAEGQLHDAIKSGGDGSLNMDRTVNYLRASLELLRNI